jgi:hypothetical protein
MSYPLEQFWRNAAYDENWETERSLVAAFRIRDFQREFNGFIVSKSDNFADPAAGKSFILIPRLYRNSLRVLNSKISYLQHYCKVASRLVSRDPSPNARESANFLLKTLVLNTSVRDAFFEDINRVFYGGVAFQSRRPKPNKPFPDDYKFHILDAWTFCEYHCGYHDPPYVHETLPEVDWENIPDVRLLGSVSFYRCREFIQFFVLDWNHYWKDWKPTGSGNSDPPSYWGPPPKRDEISKCLELKLTPQPTEESFTGSHSDLIAGFISNLQVSANLYWG